MSAVLPIARDGHLKQNTPVNLELAFARLQMQSGRVVIFIECSKNIGHSDVMNTPELRNLSPELDRN